MKKVCLCHPLATKPVRSTDGSAGYDLSTVVAHTLQPGTQFLFDTGIKMAFPDHLEFAISPRSKLANKHGIQVMAGVVDSDYRGTIGVILYNAGKEPVSFAVGDKIAQGIFQVIDVNELHEVLEWELDDTQRGESGIRDSDLRL